MRNLTSINFTESLLEKFNKRDKLAFGEVYVIAFDEINSFACHLFYSTNVDVKDLIQDLFLAIWNNRSLKFTSIVHLKNYLYLCVKNRYKDYLRHDKYIDNYRKKVLSNDDYLLSYSIESSVLNTLNEAAEMLPERCAEVLKLYLEGWNINEIALKIGKSRSSVYDIRSETIELLKKTIKGKQFSILINFL